MSEWISPFKELPKVGDHIYVTDGNEVHEIIVTGLPENPCNSNVRGWKYVEDKDV